MKKPKTRPDEAIADLGNTLNEVMPRIGPLWLDAEKEHPSTKLIGYLLRDPFEEKWYVTVIPFNVFERTLAPTTVVNQADPSEDAFAPVRADAGPDALWLVIYNGKNIYTSRIRRKTSLDEPAYSPGFTNEELPDQELLRLSLATWNAVRGRDDGRLGRLVVEGKTPLPPVLGFQFCEAWADQGYPRIVTTHRFASALMCTKAHVADVEDLHIPWTSFQVAVPNRLLIRPDTGEEYDRIIVSIKDGLAQVALYTAHGRAAWLTAVMPTTTLFSADAEVENEDRIDGGTIRVMFLARRFVAGLLLTMEESAPFADPKHGRSSVSLGREPPSHRVFAVGRPIEVNCRLAVAEFLSGERKGAAPASVQSLVRGHYKRQVVGVARSGRKVIWVEPYWRGPEDAPILARPYRVGTKDETTH